MDMRAEGAAQGWMLDGGRARLDLASRQLLVDAAKVKLSGRALDLLWALVEHRDRVVPKQELMDLVWPGLVVEENNLQVHVLSLRKLLGAQAIVTVAGRGYQFALQAEVWSATIARHQEPPHRMPPTEPAQARNSSPMVPTFAAPHEALIGRAELLAVVNARLGLDEVRLLTLSGSGGSGKTRLALHAAAQLAPVMADGAYVVMLAPVRDASHVMAAIAAALGLQEGGPGALSTLVEGFLRPRQLLLVLDNFEHLPDAAAQVAALLAAAPRLKVLATSRMLLHLAQEHEIKVPPLALPQSDAPADLALSPAVALFAQRAAALGRPLAQPTEAPAQWQAAVQICRRLDGLPLAIELAAARLGVLTPTALAARLQQSLPMLKSHAVGVPLRQQTLRDTIAWSYELLDEPAQRLFRSLGVFAGGWSVDAAEALHQAGGYASTVDGLGLLLDHNLVQRLDDVEGQPRYAMLETIREYALEQLTQAGEAAQVRDLHAAHYQALAQQGEQGLTRAGRMPWLARLRADLNNLRLALHWLARDTQQAQPAMQLAAAMTWMWYFDGAYREGIAALSEVLELPGAAALPLERAAVFSGIARLASFSGEMKTAHERGQESIEIWRSLGQSKSVLRGLAFALFNVGVPTLFLEGHERATAILREACDRFRESGDRWGVALATVYQGVVLAVLPGTESSAMPVLTEGYGRCFELGDDWAASTCSGYIGLVKMRRGDLSEARTCFEHILASARETGDRFRIGRSAHFLGELELKQKRFAEAFALLVESLRLVVEQGRQGDYPLMLCCVARALTGLGLHANAARLLAVAERTPTTAPTLPPDDPAKVESCRQACLEALGPAAYEAAWQEGSRMDIDQALRLAMSAQPSPA